MTSPSAGRGGSTAGASRPVACERAPRAAADEPSVPDRRGRGDERGVVALELAMTLPLVALLLVAAFALVDVVRSSLVAQEAARLGARVAAVDGDDAAVRRAVADVLGPAVEVRVGPRRPRGVVEVTVVVPVDVVGLPHTVTARSAAMVEPVVD